MFELIIFMAATVITLVALISVVRTLLKADDYVSYSKNEEKAACTWEDYAYLDSRFAK